MDIESVRRVYRAVDQSQGATVQQFATVAKAYSIKEPGAARAAARKYHLFGAGRIDAFPIGDSDYVGELFSLALRQPSDSQVSQVTAMAVGMSVIPDNELGKASKDDRYLALHGAAQLAQVFAAELGRSLSSVTSKQQQARIHPVSWVVFAVVIAILIAIYR